MVKGEYKKGRIVLFESAMKGNIIIQDSSLMAFTKDLGISLTDVIDLKHCIEEYLSDYFKDNEEVETLEEVKS